jgi:acyl-CoA oxidase
MGELGILATHAVLFAQLVIDGRNFGVHPFLVQIRDLVTHEAL